MSPMQWHGPGMKNLILAVLNKEENLVVHKTGNHSSSFGIHFQDRRLVNTLASSNS